MPAGAERLAASSNRWSRRWRSSGRNAGGSRRRSVPCIARKSYEVDDGLLRRFVEAEPENERFFGAGRAGHHQFDLEGYVLSRLAAAGLGRVEALGEDTYSQPDRFFSFRRATHKGEPDYGRQISLIALNP